MKVKFDYLSFQEGYFCLGMAPVIDGDFLPDFPSEIRARGEHNKVPEMVGITREDGMIYALACK